MKVLKKILLTFTTFLPFNAYGMDGATPEDPMVAQGRKVCALAAAAEVKSPSLGGKAELMKEMAILKDQLNRAAPPLEGIPAALRRAPARGIIDRNLDTQLVLGLARILVKNSSGSSAVPSGAAAMPTATRSGDISDGDSSVQGPLGLSLDSSLGRSVVLEARTLPPAPTSDEWLERKE